MSNDHRVVINQTKIQRSEQTNNTTQTHTHANTNCKGCVFYMYFMRALTYQIFI